MSTQKEKQSSSVWDVLLPVIGGIGIGAAATYFAVKSVEQPQEAAPNRQATSSNRGRPRNLQSRQPREFKAKIHGEKCAICLEKFQAIRRLRCGHVFHDDCAAPWINGGNGCPICRQK